jgi:hypothetical protein
VLELVVGARDALDRDRGCAADNRCRSAILFSVERVLAPRDGALELAAQLDDGARPEVRRAESSIGRRDGRALLRALKRERILVAPRTNMHHEWSSFGRVRDVLGAADRATLAGYGTRRGPRQRSLPRPLRATLDRAAVLFGVKRVAPRDGALELPAELDDHALGVGELGLEFGVGNSACSRSHLPGPLLRLGLVGHPPLGARC